MKTCRAGTTDFTIDVFIQDSSSAVGAGLTGLVYNSASLVCYYRKGQTGTATALSLATQTVGGAHSDGGFVQISSANMPGVYRLDLSDTMLSAEGMTTIQLNGAANMAPCNVEILVTSATRGLSGTALPNAAADAAGGLPISDAGGLDLDLKLANTNEVTAARMGALTDWIDGGRLDLILDARASQASLDVVDAIADTILVDSNELQTDWANGGRLDVILDAKAMTSELPASFNTWAIGTLTSGERTAIANEVEAQIIDDTDSEKVLTAITDKIASVNPSLEDLTLAAIASSVAAQITSDHGAGSYVRNTEPLDAAGTRAAIGLGSANIDTQLGDLPTNSELNAALAAADDAVLAQVALVKSKTDNLPTDPADASDIDGAFSAMAVLIADLPTSSELNTALAGADDAVLAQVALIKLRTDLIPDNPAAVEDIPTAGQNAVALLDLEDGIETDLTFRQAQRLQTSALAGEVSGASTEAVVIKNTTGDKDRITATVDEHGNRSEVVTDVS